MLYYIYALFNKNFPGTYIGHTKNLKVRLENHKFRAKTRNSKVYKYIRETGGIWKMEVLEWHECDKQYAKERERYYIELMGDLNTEIPGREKPEYYLDNKERFASNNKKWHKNNPEKVKEHWTKQNEKNKLDRYTCECGSSLRKADKNRHEKTAKHTAYENEKKNI